MASVEHFQTAISKVFLKKHGLKITNNTIMYIENRVSGVGEFGFEDILTVAVTNNGP